MKLLVDLVKDLEVGDGSELLLGYHYTGDDLSLRSVETGEKYKWEYEEIASGLNKYLETILRKMGFKSMQVPKAPQEKHHTLIYGSDGYETKDVLLVICQGSGAVRPGLWSRAVCINDSLKAGTCIPYILEAQERGWGVLLLNPNDNVRKIEGNYIPIEQTSSPEEHVRYVWKNYISGSAFEKIFMLAHSYGGICTVELLGEIEEARKRIAAIALTDSVHGRVSEKAEKIMKERAINFASSHLPLGEELESRGCPTVSAGTDIHEYTSHFAFASVFQFLEEFL